MPTVQPLNPMQDFIVPQQELSLETEPSLLPVRQYGTVCMRPLDQLRFLLVQVQSENLFVQYLLLTGLYFLSLINIINTVMPGHSIFVIGWALN